MSFICIEGLKTKTLSPREEILNFLKLSGNCPDGFSGSREYKCSDACNPNRSNNPCSAYGIFISFVIV
jgi:hypothetical protein